MILVLVAGLLLLNTSAIAANENGDKNNNIKSYDPWGQKEILNYLLCTADDKLQNDVIQLQHDLELTDNQMQQLKILAQKEHELLREKIKAKGNRSLNDEIKQTFNEVDKATQKILEGKYMDFRKWIINWWYEERIYREEWLKKKTAESREEVGPWNEDDNYHPLIDYNWM